MTDFRSFIMTQGAVRRPFRSGRCGKSLRIAREFCLSSPAGLVEMPGTGKLSCILVKNSSTRHRRSAMTTKKKPKVYITRKLPDVVETRMRELFDAELNIDDTPRTRAELVAAVQRG